MCCESSHVCWVTGSLEVLILRAQGVTVYRALKYSQAHIGDWIALPGAGGGLGHLAIQYATSMGLRVVAIGKPSRSRNTRTHC